MPNDNDERVYTLHLGDIETPGSHNTLKEADKYNRIVGYIQGLAGTIIAQDIKLPAAEVLVTLLEYIEDLEES